MRHPRAMSDHRSVGRIVDLLDVVARADVPPTVSDLARRLDVPRSSVHDLVSGLEQHGWLLRAGRGLRIGPAPLVLELLAARHVSWTSLDADAYAERFDLAAAVAVLVGRHVVYTARSQKVVDERYAHVADLHLPRDPLTTAAGRLLLSTAPAAVLAGVLDETRATDPALVADYEAQLPLVRRRRTAWSDGLSQDEVAAVAVFPHRDRREALVLFGRRGTDAARLTAAARTLARAS